MYYPYLTDTTENFNCTIQELKPSDTSIARNQEINFNCTIQELKLQLVALFLRRNQTFQLHHTGIKTNKEGRQLGS